MSTRQESQTVRAQLEDRAALLRRPSEAAQTTSSCGCAVDALTTRRSPLLLVPKADFDTPA